MESRIVHLPVWASEWGGPGGCWRSRSCTARRPPGSPGWSAGWRRWWSWGRRTSCCPAWWGSPWQCSCWSRCSPSARRAPWGPVCPPGTPAWRCGPQWLCTPGGPSGRPAGRWSRSPPGSPRSPAQAHIRGEFQQNQRSTRGQIIILLTPAPMKDPFPIWELTLYHKDTAKGKKCP